LRYRHKYKYSYIDPKIAVNVYEAGVVYLFQTGRGKEHQLFQDTPWKINMEPTNHPFRKENDLPNPYDYVPC